MNRARGRRGLIEFAPKNLWHNPWTKAKIILQIMSDGLHLVLFNFAASWKGPDGKSLVGDSRCVLEKLKT